MSIIKRNKKIESNVIITTTTELYDPNKDYRQETIIVSYHEGYPWTRLFRKIFKLPTPYTIIIK